MTDIRSMVLITRNQILRSAGYIVVSVMSVREGIQRFQDGDFDLIMLCHTLPINDGERLISFIRASGSRILIVCVSEAESGQHNGFAYAISTKIQSLF